MSPGRALVVRTGSAEETRAVGAALGRSLRAGVTLSLEGPLGAGKTEFIRGLCEALGVEDPVTSPTYTLQNVYRAPGGRRVIHVDAFRLGAPEEYEDLAVVELAGEGREGGGGTGEAGVGGSVVVVEWGDRVAAALPRDTVRIVFEVQGESGRTISIRVPPGVEIEGAFSGKSP